jgi:hypothetical protein
LSTQHRAPTGFQIIPYHLVFDVKYDPRYNARLVEVGSCTVNDKEDIYSGVVHMDIVFIGFFLGELYGFSCCACEVGIDFLYGKTKDNVCKTAGPKFGTNVYSKSIMIDKYLHGLKTSATRFDEHLRESLLRLSFKQTKY